MIKPKILALNQTITWDRGFKKRKMFRKEEIIELIKQFQADQNDYCYKEMLGQVREELKPFVTRMKCDPQTGASLSLDSVWLQHIFNWWQALQGLEEG